ncbi:MAG: S1 RNA-binding domain-containing protein [Candidatus Omnitrophica bacterium]|nr:S1 RNA-binding domain-containing protein [Candidatus Omnitrophota bacterium]MDD5081068.1 S1 RNA-binding domain-containing protein [Candidatus Omnitrophota bacterium]
MENVVTDLEKAYFDSIKELKEGELVNGKVVSVTEKEVIVDVGYKSEGVISRDEFLAVDLENLGDFEVYVENVEDDEGRVVLSFKKANELKGWKKLSETNDEGDLVEGVVVRKVKGGYMVDVYGVKGFLPQSLSAFKNVKENVIGVKYNFQIVKMNKIKNNFILSRKDALRAERDVLRKKIWEEIEEGTIIKGHVKSIANFGAFIDLGGVDGLLHIGDMSWKKITHPSEIVAVGDDIDVMVLSFDKDKGKISLGLKQTTPDPWIDIDKKYLADSIVKGRVTNIQNYGVFVELEKGIEGLIHVSEISWTKKFVNLNETFAVGDAVEAKVISVEPQDRKISLSIKKLEKDPWENVEKVIELDSVINGEVSGFGEGCAYVELANGLEGIIYSEDISWTKRVNRAQELLKRGQACDFKVLGLDRDQRKVLLGIKQLKNDPWPSITEKFAVDTIIEGEVVKVANFGAFIKIDDDLEGLLFSGEIDKERMDTLKPNDKIKVKVIKIDPGVAKIGLSANLDNSAGDASVSE